MMPKHANIGFNPLKNAVTPKPASNFAAKMPPIPGMGQSPTGAAGIPPMGAMTPAMSTAPKIAGANHALLNLVPIPKTGLLSVIAAQPAMKEMKKVPGLAKVATSPEDFLALMKNLKGTAPGGMMQALKGKITPLAMTGKEIMSPASKIAPFSVSAQRLSTMNNTEARNLLGSRGIPPIPKKPAISVPKFNSAPTISSMTPPPLPGKPPMQHGTVVNRFLGK